jgi:hypothetical protein
VVLVCGGVDVATWAVTDWDHRDLGIVDTLASLQLLAHRMECTIEVRDPGPELTGLLDLVGMSDLLGVRHALGIEPVGKPERREQPGVEKVVMPDDPAV